MLRIYSKNGFLLGEWDACDRFIADMSFHAWPQAHLYMLGEQVLGKK